MDPSILLQLGPHAVCSPSFLPSYPVRVTHPPAHSHLMTHIPHQQDKSHLMYSLSTSTSSSTLNSSSSPPFICSDDLNSCLLQVQTGSLTLQIHPLCLFLPHLLFWFFFLWATQGLPALPSFSSTYPTFAPTVAFQQTALMSFSLLLNFLKLQNCTLSSF